jgi:hypothetical protein
MSREETPLTLFGLASVIKADALSVVMRGDSSIAGAGLLTSGFFGAEKAPVSTGAFSTGMCSGVVDSTAMIGELN